MNLKQLRATLLLTIIIILSSCSGMKPIDFADKSPRFIPEQYFLGKSQGTGLFFDRSRDLLVSFTVDLEGVPRGEYFDLKEHLKFGTGEMQERTYTLRKVNENLYDLTCPDLVGPAKVESYGNAIKLTYSLKQKFQGKEITLDFNDWMFLQSNQIVLNRAFASKFGLDAGEVFMSIKRL